MGRINWVDASRGLAFLMVIYYHLSTKGHGGIVPYFSPVFLTIFFFVSGYLTKSGKNFIDVFEQRTRTLFVPLILFGFLCGFILNICKHMTLKDGFIDAFQDVFCQYGEHRALWFIASLYVFSLIFYWIDYFCRTQKQLLIVCFGLIFVNQIIKYTMEVPELPWRMDTCLWACAIMGLGKLYRGCELEFDKTMLKWWIVLLSFVSYLMMIYVGHQNIIYYGSSNWLYAIAIPATGLLSMLYVSKKIIVNSKVFLFIGTNTLVYFALHRQILNGVESFFFKYIYSMEINPSLWINLIEVVIIAALLVIPTCIINKYIPQVIGKGWKIPILCQYHKK